MNMEIWCKSFLSIYNIIPNLTNSIDKLINVKSVASSGFCLTSTSSTYAQLENIAILTQKKVNLINLKLLCDEVLLEMNNASAKLIMLKYIDGLACEEILKLTALTRRTYFRKLKKALKDFELRLYTKILKNNVLYKNFVNDSFFNNIFEKINVIEQNLISNKKEVNISNFSSGLCNMILKQMKKAF